MPLRRRRSSLGTRLLVSLLAAVLVPSLVVAVILVRTGAQTERQEAERALGVVAESVSDETLDLIGTITAVLTSTSVFHAFYDRNRAEQSDTLQSVLAGSAYIRRISVYYAPGAPPFTTTVKPGAQWQPPGDLISLGFRRAIRGDRFISPVHYDSTGPATCLVMVPIAQPGGAPIGVVAAVISLERVQDIADRFGLADRIDVLVVDNTGRALARPESYPHLQVGASLRGLEPVQRLLARGNGMDSENSTIYTSPNGVRVLAVYSRVEDLGWGVVVQQPLGLIQSLPYRSVALALLWMAGFVLLFALLGRYVSLRVTRPLARLKEGTEIVGAGDLGYRVHIRTGDELEDVADAFNRTVAQLEVSYEELEEEHNRAVVAARKADTLYGIAQTLVSTLRLDERLDLIARNLTAVCNTDKVAIWLLRGSMLIPSTSFGLSPDEKRAFQKWQVRHDESTSLTQQVLSTRKPLVANDAESDPRIPQTVTRAFRMRSVLALPLLIEDEVIGYAVTYVSDRKHEFTDYEVTMAKAVAAQAAVAIENAQAYERERRIAETLQRSFLPDVPPTIGHFEIADMYESALTEAEVGGDFYDLIQLSPTRVAFVMGDISGKGLSAAVHTAMVKYTLRAYTLEDIGSTELIRRLNQAVWRFISGQVFVTLFYGVLDTETNELAYINAGHELPFLFGEDRRICMRLQTTGTALGIVPDYQYGEERIEFSPGDSLLLYTDGATDVRRNGEFLGEDGVEGFFCAAASGSAHDIVATVADGIREYAGGQLHDDVALMVIQYHRDGVANQSEN